MTNKPSVAVLLAAHNGIEWIKEQIDTIFQQKEVNIFIFLSVDVSSDGTFEWCKELPEINCRIKALPHGNHFGGAAKNFFRLIKDVNLNLFDFVSLADQDDIWLPNKLSRAVEIIKIKKLEGYSSNVVAFWEDGREKLIKKSSSQKKFDYFFESGGPGCTYVFKRNSIQKFKKFLIKNWSLVNEVESHDWFIYAYFRSLSMLWYIDKTPSMYYRQHKNNQVGANLNWKAYLYRLQKINSGWYRSEVQRIINLLKPQACETIVLNRLFLIFNFYKLRRRLKDALVFLIINIFGFF